MMMVHSMMSQIQQMGVYFLVVALAFWMSKGTAAFLMGVIETWNWPLLALEYALRDVT